MKMIEYKYKYGLILFIASIWYFCMSFIDYTITTIGYEKLGQQFFEIELNESISYCLLHGINPVHMFIIPFALILLSWYFLFKMRIYDRCKIKEINIYALSFAISLIILLGIIHLVGFLSWFYYGVF